MAQADYVTIPIRTSIPDVGAKPSTSPARGAHADANGKQTADGGQGGSHE